MAKAPPRNIRFDPDVLEALQKAAAEEDRTASWLVNKAVRDWLEERGYLAKGL